MNNKTWIAGFRPAGEPYVEQLKKLLLARNKSLKKMVELLHLQLVRKGRARGYIRFYHPTLKVNLYYYDNYDIKSPDPSPYNYNSHYALGLNQYFVGQSPYKYYQGNLKDGIYHDDCEIIAGGYGLTNISVNGWVKYRDWDGEVSRTYYSFAPWLLKDNSGNMVLMGMPKSFIENRKFSLIYKITRHRDNGVNFSANVIEFDWTYYTKVYEQITINGEQVTRETGETSSFTILRNREHHIYEDREENILVRYIRPYISIKKIYSYGIVGGGLGSDHTYPIEFWNNADVVMTGPELQLSYTDRYSGKHYTLYPVGAAYLPANPFEQPGVVIFHDGRVGNLTTFWGQMVIYLMDTFYVDTHMPVRGAMNWYKEWNTHYRLFVDEDKGVPGWVMPIAAIAIMVGSYFTGGAIAASATSIMGAASATAVSVVTALSYASAIFTGLSLVGVVNAMVTGNASSLKGAKVFGVLGSITGIASAVTSVWHSFSSQVALNASGLSASATASNSGLSQTASLYTATGSANASAVGANMATALPGGFSMVSGNSGTFIISSSGGLATNVATGSTMAITGSNSIFGGMSSVNVLTSNITISSFTSANMLYSPVTANALMPSVFTGSGIGSSQFSNIINGIKSLYKAYSDTRSIFRKPNEFSDDEMPTNDDKPQINFIPMNSELIKRKHYNISDDYDLGLEPGTLLYIPSVRDKFNQ
ncbi:putative membrane protein [Campylobacter hyointestinalis subsp. lawsonii CCUG 27631]|uniref:hypothetical protein n=1 Tax=Campylobacter hyointestinalis TaxID=198 RepID=UPI0007C9318A|nr:hypothetical protein [Campylobacter hyointestinalis]ANE34340.1 putative membrane protein [Campylobacter hyointestinalis subsp. lawsonii CCUG 27631]